MEEKLTANNVELATVTEKDGFKVLNEEEVKAAVEAIWGQSAIWPRISVVLSAPVFLVQVGKKFMIFKLAAISPITCIFLISTREIEKWFLPFSHFFRNRKSQKWRLSYVYAPDIKAARKT